MAAYPITAYALCNALGLETAAVTDRLSKGRSGLQCRGDATVGAVDQELPEVPSELGADTRQGRLTWATARQLLGATARAAKRWGAARLGVVVGTSTGGIAATEEAYAHHREHGTLTPGFEIERHHAMMATVDLVQAATGARGPGYVVSTACSSSGKVFGSVQRLLDAGVVDAVVVGGVDSLCTLTQRGFHSLEVLSPEACRPFCAERRGINLGEGGALALVERQGDAAVSLVAVGESSDAHHMSAPHPEGLGARLAMERALARAELDATRVSHINAHGTATLQGDAAEAMAIRNVFGAEVPIVATKGYTGHLLGAAGATEALLAVLSIEWGWLPQSLGCDPLDTSLGVNINLEHRPFESDFVLSNSLAFGGSNVSVLLGARDA